MQIKDYQKLVDQWINTIGVRYFSELTNMAILSEEVGEVARLMARMYGEQSFREEISIVEQKDKLADELADVIWVVTCMANQTGIDLESALAKNFDKKNSRDSKRHINNIKISK
jgi:NTP pyrophosphatase (non-canonical NTP hydrolase)